MIDFFFTQWTSPRYAKKLHNCKLYLCRGNCCIVLTSTNGQTVSLMAVPELECHQEEADTRLFLHAQHAASSRSAVVIIRSPDTDVAVIGCSLAAQIPAQVLLHTGSKERRRYISLHVICSSSTWKWGVPSSAWFACFYRVRQHRCIFRQRQKGCLQNAPSWKS